MSAHWRQVAWLAQISRPLRRSLLPGHFKESYINRALDGYSQPTYVEIGVRKGECFRSTRAARKVGIDPDRHDELRTLRPAEEFHAMASDEFFAERAPAVLEHASVHVALIDGLHEFRQVARDLLNIEPYMRPDGMVFLDDINPRTRERAVDTWTGGPWNGDVWKVAALLPRVRPALQLRTIDADEGLGVVTGFGGAQAEGADPRVALQECKALDYEYLEEKRPLLLNLIAPAQFDPLAWRAELDDESGGGGGSP